MRVEHMSTEHKIETKSIPKVLKVPFYNVFHQFHTAVTTTLYSKCIAPNPFMVLNFSCLKVAQVSSTEIRLFLCLHL